jgi:hypothetical protein
MGTLLTILAVGVGIVNLVLFIIVLIKLFQNQGILLGIIGLICGIYTFIWGWINAGRLGITNIMIAWSVCLVLIIILNGAVAAFQ